MSKDKSLNKAIAEEARRYGAELSLAIDRLDESIPDGGAELSKDSECKTLELIAASRQRRELPLRQIRVAACVLLAFVICIGGATMSVEAWRARLINFLYNENAPYTKFYFGDGTSFETQDNPLPDDSKILLEYVPEGFGLVESYTYPHGEYYEFENADGKTFSVRVGEPSKNFSVDTEDAKVEELCISDYDGLCITKKGHTMILWYDDIHIFTVAGYIDKAELLKVAKGIRYRE